LSERDLGQILPALGRYGVLRFPDQHLDLSELKRFSEQFGEIQGPATRGRDPTQEYPKIDILSNLKEGGKYIGSPDAGQDWHNDMTYREVPGFVNVLYGIRIPHREGKPLGGARGQAGWPPRRGRQRGQQSCRAREVERNLSRHNGFLFQRHSASRRPTNRCAPACGGLLGRRARRRRSREM
jgi:hypothetical protein